MTYLEQRRKHIEDGRPLPEKKKYFIPKVSKKRAEKIEAQKLTNSTGGKKSESELLDAWFKKIQDYHCGQDTFTFCMECGAVVPVGYMRHATAHLLPKKLFKSVATHPLNYLVLGAGCGCHEKTHRVDKFVKMKVWPEAARRINLMMPGLPFDELKHLSSQLLAELAKAESRLQGG